MNDPAHASERQSKLHQLRIERPQPGGRGGSRWGLAVLLLVVAGVTAWWFLRPPAAVAVSTALAQAVTVSASSAASVLDATGYVTARRQATVSSEITGKVREVFVEEGLVVEEGQVLATLDDTTEQAELRLSQAQLEATRAALAETQAQLTEARRNLDRTSELNARQLASSQDLDAAEALVATLAARLGTGRENVGVAESTVALRQQRIDEFVIRAPFAGVVIAKNAQPGEMISPISAGGGFTRTGICTIVDMASLEIEVDVNEAYIQRVRPGQSVTATLDAYPDWRIPAEVIAIIPAADRQRATVRVRIGFLERDERILPDMGVGVAFLEVAAPEAGDTEGPTGVVVPSRAVARRDGGSVVFVVEDGRVARRDVRIAGVDGAQTRLMNGVTAGERVVLDPGDTLEDGTVVAPE